MKEATINTTILLVGEHALHSGDFKLLPRIGEKIVIRGDDDAEDFDDRCAKIYEVIDVHRTLDGKADVFVKCLGLELNYAKALIEKHKGRH